MGLTVAVVIKRSQLILRLKGELDELSVRDLRLRISNYIDTYKIRHLILNVEKLSFMDSSGIGFIIGRYHQLKQNGGDVTICCMNQKIERIIGLSGLTRICSIRESEEVCVESYGGKI